MRYFPHCSKPAEQNQDKHDKEYEAETATTVVGSTPFPPNERQQIR
jgi:hypothetical protein